MEKVTVKCPAKINLSLDVVGKREDGYHLLKMIMQTVSLYDEVTIDRVEEGISVYCDNINVPCDESNSAIKAAKLMFDRYSLKGGINIFIDKNIPIAAGLAGGSADAAGVIKGIDKLFALKLSEEEMKEIALKIGADVPYCIVGGTMLAEGIGEVLTSIKPFNGVYSVIAKPNIDVSTAEVYKSLKIEEITRHCDMEKVIKLIENEEIEGFSSEFLNVLELVTIKDHPIINEIKAIMLHCNAYVSLMSGSGPSVFGLFKTEEEAIACSEKLKTFLNEVYVVKTC